MSKQKLKWTKQCKCGYYIPDEYDRCDKCLLKDFNEQLETPITIDELGDYLYLEEEVVKALGGYLRHMFLPLFTLSLFNFGGWLLLTRATMIETITEDYILTARAKGVGETSVLFRHALKNASLPIITSAAMSFGFLLSGAIITETVYTYPGVGGWSFFAITTRDIAVMMAIFYVISLCVILANIIADLLYGVLDPRIKYG